MDKGKGGFEDILVCTDVFTKFTVAVPCKDQTALTTALITIQFLRGTDSNAF
jgi:hypothetical protein